MTPRRKILRGVKLNKNNISEKLGPACKFFEKISEIQRWLTLRGVNSEQANTARIQTPHMLTLRRVLHASFLSLQASPCLEREKLHFLKIYGNYFKITLREVKFFKLNIRISS